MHTPHPSDLWRVQDIIPLVERFNHRKWERFNSEKVCNISYARIQGRSSLVAHFQNSSLMHEDKRCRPILFTSGAHTWAAWAPPHIWVFASSGGACFRARANNLAVASLTGLSPWRVCVMSCHVM